MRLNPDSRPVKEIEMSIRRAHMLNSGLMEALTDAGDMATLKASRVWYAMSNKYLRDALRVRDGLPDMASRDDEVWCWMIEHWYSGGLRRSVKASMYNIMKENRMRIDNKLSEMK